MLDPSRGVAGGSLNSTIFAFALLLGVQTAHADFDESVNFAPPFSVNQNDKELSDLFDPTNGKSSLCVPTTLANIVAYQAEWRIPAPYSKLALVQEPETGDYDEQVRYFAKQCGTDPVNGTVVAHAANCMRQFYRNSGYFNGWVYLIGMEENTDPVSVAFWHGLRPLAIEDIRYYVGSQVGVLMDVYWEEQQDPTTTPAPNPLQSEPWVRKGGHTFMIAGYDYNYSWGQNQIQLKVVNPENTYTTGDTSTHYDEVTMTSLSSSDGTFPPGFTYVLSGTGFSTGKVRGYVRNIMVFLPDRSVAPRMP